jgi:hypothetical protein
MEMRRGRRKGGRKKGRKTSRQTNKSKLTTSEQNNLNVDNYVSSYL